MTTMAQMATDTLGQRLENVDCELCGGSDPRLLFVAKDRYGDPASEFRVVRCKTCRLVYVNPRPTDDCISAFYPADYFDDEVLHKSIDPESLLWLEARRLRDIERFASGRSILDVGCGTGQFLGAAKAAGWTTLGVEVSTLAAGYAREHYGLDVIQKDVLAAQLPDETFDVVTMWMVLEHLHHPRPVLGEVFRVLKPGGLFVALVPNISSTQARIFGPTWPPLDVPRHLYHFSQDTLRQLAASAGLRPVWFRFFAKEHDAPNLLNSVEATLYGHERATPGRKRAAARQERPRWTWRRVLMGATRRSAPLLARAMAGRRRSAALEAYFRKQGPGGKGESACAR